MIKLKSTCKDYIWGGTKLRADWGKTSNAERIAESWELSCHKDGINTIIDESYSDMTFAEYIQQNGKTVLGTNCDRFDYFPILVKLIDASDNLSVQVHPNDEYALRVEGEYGKTEMWYVADCDDGAFIYYGFNKDIGKEEFSQRISDNTLTEVLNLVRVKKGDVFFIESGTLHAIGKGCLIAEIQQNSNTTYRVYDYERIGADGKPRELHIEKALDVTTLSPAKSYPTYPEIKNSGYVMRKLVSCDYFDVTLVEVDTTVTLNADETSFNSLLILDGNAKIGSLSVEKGDSIFVNANEGEYSVSGKCMFLLTKIV